MYRQYLLARKQLVQDALWVRNSLSGLFFTPVLRFDGLDLELEVRNWSVHLEAGLVHPGVEGLVEVGVDEVLEVANLT